MDKLNRRDFIASSGAIAAAGVATGAARAAAPAGSPPPASGTPEPSFARRATPLRFNASIDDCEVVGKIPDDIDGAFYRVGYEWYYPPRFPDDAILNADGYISMFRIKDGRVHYRGRWVETHRLQQLRKAGRQLYGYYRNPYTDDPSVADPSRPNLRTVANTAPLVHGGKLFALKEDGLPHRIDPNTLETLGPWDFDGAYRSQTFTAHPKIDPVTGEMISFGYEATGLASDDLWIYIHDRDGRVKREIRTKVPYVSVIHDMAITQKYILIPFGGYVTSPERLHQGKVHWGWDATQPSYIGVIPRDGEGRDMRWFKGPLRCMMHTLNAQDEKDGTITLYAPFWDGNFFPFFPNVDGSPFNPALARAFIRRITIDPRSRRDGYREEVLWPGPVNDLGKVDPQVMSLPTRYFFTSYGDPERPFDRARIGEDAPASATNCYGRFDVATGRIDSFFAGPVHGLQEVSFVPRKGGAEGEGYLVGVAENFAERRGELVIVDAQRPGDGEIARVLLPFRLSPQVHGIWASAGELPLA
jgi:carotenoid cleavage dioxygenase-like enzyme